MEIDLDPSMQTLDPNARQVIAEAALAWVRQKQNAAPDTIAPADGGRPGDEQYPAPVDGLRLLDTDTGPTATVYDVEASVGGTIEHIAVVISDDGTVEVRPAE